ncbi:hypothetical protein QTP70_002970 [Hemibagrus guttatus]|uniref:NXPE C-terminal domain-containing protein n=1 Tax=Hemibagrus guttatus TaxID=175788 RepID=A0AAE0R3N4_9TELE|nr:hypothetical protein QTP70_002970 [Hemibagrus guttatus]KAK3568245.1 hypothetical protein QTP86_002004 [Hemibagrus guttatus]
MHRIKGTMDGAMYHQILDLKHLNLYTPRRVGPFMAVDSTNNILVSFRCHGPPIRFTSVRFSELRYVANEIDRIQATLVVIHTANLQKLDPENSMFYSNWFCLQIDTVLRAMFKGLSVKMLDAWEMTLAHHLPHDLYPPQAIIKNMVNVILSYICPAGKI